MSKTVWKSLAIIGGVASVSLIGLILWFARELSDGFADAFGYPRSRRFLRRTAG